MSILFKHKSLPYPFLLWLPLCALFIATTAYTQRRGPRQDFRAAALVTIDVSPDGITLAIARSSSEAIQRNGRVELWNLKTGELLRTITGFDGSIWSVSFSPDGQSLITASTEFREEKIATNPKDRKGTVVAELKWWNTKTGEFSKRVSLPGQGRSGLSASLSPDGNIVATVERYTERGINILDDGVANLPGISIRRPTTSWGVSQGVEIKLLDVQSGNTKVKLDGGSTTSPAYWYRRLERPFFSPDGKTLAVISAGEVKLWNVSSGDKVETLKKFKGRPVALSFSPDSRILAVASIKVDTPWDEASVRQSEISLWDLSTGKAIKKLNGRNDAVASLQFAAGGRALLIGSLQYERERTIGTVKMWDLQTNRLAILNVHEGQTVSSLTLLPDSPAVVLQSGSDVEARDAVTWKVKYSFEASANDEIDSRAASRFLLSVKRVVAVAFSSDGTTVSGEIPDEGIKLWDPRTGGVKKQIRNVHAPDSVVAASSNGRVLAELGPTELRLWDLTAGTNSVLPFSAAVSVAALALSADGQLLAMGVDDEIKLRQTTEGNSTRTLNGHGSALEFLVFSDNGGTLVSADEEGTIKIWDVPAGQLKKTISSSGRITALSVDASGEMLATAREDYSISLWDLRIGAQRSTLKKHTSVVNALVFSLDGTMLASGGDDRTAILWDTTSGKSKRTLKGHDLTVTSLAFSPDGQSIASGSGNASVVLWNVLTGKLDRILR
jgi:WD40 repeat protein